jgi:hypothetical protein
VLLEYEIEGDGLYALPACDLLPQNAPLPHDLVVRLARCFALAVEASQGDELRGLAVDDALDLPRVERGAAQFARPALAAQDRCCVDAL